MTTDHTAAPLAPGTVIGEYRIRQSLGADSQGFRYLADHPIHRNVLLHEFFAHSFAQREAQHMTAIDAGDRVALRWWVRSYLDRAHSVAAVRHPRLLPLLDSTEQHGGAWCSWSAPTAPLLQTQLERGSALAGGSVEALLTDLMDAAEALHAAGIVHRAIGPQLIWARDDGRAVLGGFGSLRASIRFRSHALHSVAPAPYAAPEEMQADAQITAAADLYAIAAVVHHAATGQAPPSAEQRIAGAALPSLAAAVGGGLPETLAAGIERALALDAAQRPQTVSQWRELMHLRARPAATPAPAPPPVVARGGNARTWIMIATPLLLIAAIAGFMLMGHKAPREVAKPAVAVFDPNARAPTDTDRPRFVSASLGAGAEAPALNQAAIEAISAEIDTGPTVEQDAPEPTATPRASAAPIPTAAAQPTQRPVAITEAPAARETASAQLAPPPVAEEIAVLTPPTAAAITPAEAETAQPDAASEMDHAQQLALERSRCARHVSELFAGRQFTYADIARFDDVIKLDNGRLQTPKLRIDDGRRVAFLIDTQGCVLRMMR